MPIQISKDGTVQTSYHTSHRTGRLGWIVNGVVLVTFVTTLRSVIDDTISTTFARNVEEIMNEPTFSSLSSSAAALFNNISSFTISSTEPKDTKDIGRRPFSDSDIIPLAEILNTSKPYGCPNGQVKVGDHILPISITHSNRYIPRIIHVTAKNRCVPEFVRQHLQQWQQFENHTFVFWDDPAADRLMELPIVRTIFPNLQRVSSCITTGATKSDLWRYVALYLYGGIYTDIDSGTTPELDLNKLIRPDDLAWSTIEQLGIPSQYFIASAPGHPWMYHTLNRAIDNLYTIPNVMVNNPAKITGPKAVKEGFVKFQEAVNVTTNGYEPEGLYTGDYKSSDTNRFSVSPDQPWTIHLIGQKEKSQQYVNRVALAGPRKDRYWKASNMSHYHSNWKTFPKINQISCAEHIARQEQRWNGTFYQTAKYVFENGVYRDVSS